MRASTGDLHGIQHDIEKLREEIRDFSMAIDEFKGGRGTPGLGPSLQPNTRPARQRSDKRGVVQVVTRAGHREEVLLHPALPDSSTCAQMVQIYNNYWSGVTGKRLQFTFKPEEQPYISPTEAAFVRNRILRGFFQRRPRILEIGVGVGGELWPTLFTMNPEVVVGLEPSDPKIDGPHAFGTLKHNERQMRAAFPEIFQHILCLLYDLTPSGYFHEYMNLGGHWHLITLDPPFVIQQIDDETEATNEERRREIQMLHEADLQQSLDWVVHHVLLPMARHKVTCDLFCLKSRYPSGMVQTAWNRFAQTHFEQTQNAQFKNLVFFDAIGACPYRALNAAQIKNVQAGKATKGVFYWVMFSSMDARTQTVHNSEMWNAVCREGKTIYVSPDEVQKPDLDYPYTNFVAGRSFHLTRERPDDIEIQGVKIGKRNRAWNSKKQSEFEDAVKKGSRHERNPRYNPYATPHEEVDHEGWTNVGPGGKPVRA